MATRSLIDSEQNARSYNATDDLSRLLPPPAPAQLEPLAKQTKADLCWMLAGLWAGVCLGAFDGTVVATLLTPIGSEFNASDQASYIGTAYLLSVCCFTPLYGRLADILGRKGAMLVALTLFGSGTILCGTATSMNALLAARTLAGMGGGGVMTVSSVAVTDLIPLEQRGIYQGIANVLYGLGAAVGGPVGGWINDHFGWRWAFFVQAPFFAFSMIVVATKVNIELSEEIQNESLTSKVKRIDFLGTATLAVAIASLLLGFSLKATGELAWTSPTLIALFSACLLSTLAFIWVEKSWAPYPVMPLRLIVQQTPLMVSIGNLFASMSAFSFMYNAPLYFMAVRLKDTSVSGMYMLPHSIAIPVGSLLAGWLMRRTGKLYGLTVACAVSAMVASLLASCWNESTPSWHLWLDLVPSGCGMAGFVTSTLIAMITSVMKEDIAVATGITYVWRTAGQVMGVSLSGALMQGVLLAKLKQRIEGPGSAEMIHTIRHTASIIPSLEPHIRQAAVDSYADALRAVFLCQTAVSFLAFLCSLPIRAPSFPQATDTPPASPSSPSTACSESWDRN